MDPSDNLLYDTDQRFVNAVAILERVGAYDASHSIPHL